MNDPDANSWIEKVAKEWSGAIPATVIYRNDKRKFYEQSFTEEELEETTSNGQSRIKNQIKNLNQYLIVAYIYTLLPRTVIYMLCKQSERLNKRIRGFKKSTMPTIK